MYMQQSSFFFCVRSDLILRAFFKRILRITAVYRAIGPAIPTSAYLRAAPSGANWVYCPSGSDFGQAQRRSPSQATHASHLDGVFCLLLHTRNKIQGTMLYCPIQTKDVKGHG
jgi:hypothetical protein